MSVNVIFCCLQPKIVEFREHMQVHELSSKIDLDLFLNEGLSSSFYAVCNGRRINWTSPVEVGRTYHILPRILGGKGGFGSMLRAIGAQIEKTTSREACRDLSGRRMRDINNEKKLKEWLSKEADREREREQARQERIARHLNPAQHKFDDPEYHEQRTKVEEDLQDALNKGLKRAHEKTIPGACPSKAAKLRKTEVVAGSSKREWLGVDIDSDELDSDSDNEAQPVSISPEQNCSASVAEAENFSEKSDPNTLRMSSTILSEDAVDATKTSCMQGSEAESLSCHQDITSLKSNSPVQGTSNSPVQGTSQSLLSTLPSPSANVTNSEQISLDVSQNQGDSTEPVDLELYSSSASLKELGLERLKCALTVRGLKCGGTIDERAERLFSVKGLNTDDIDPCLFAKSKGKGKRTKQSS